MKLKIEPKRIEEIMKYIEDKDEFIVDLMTALQRSLDENDVQYFDDCLDQWEDVAELASTPCVVENVWKSYRQLVDAGLIDGPT
jgi:Ribonuclease G/E